MEVEEVACACVAVPEDPQEDRDLDGCEVLQVGDRALHTAAGLLQHGVYGSGVH